MEITLELLDKINEDILDKTNVRHILSALDARMRMVYNHIYNPNLKERTLTVFSTEEREAEAEENKKRIAEADPVTILKLATNYLLDNMYTRFRNELSAHIVSDDTSGFFNGRVVRAKLSFISFCSYVSGDNPHADTTKNQELRKRLTEQGYIINDRKTSGKIEPCLVDCDKNRELLQNYLQSVGGHTVEFHSRNNVIYSATTRIDIQKYPEYRTDENEPNRLYLYPLDYEFTADDQHRIKKLIRDIRFALYSHSLITDSNCIPSLLLSYMYELEGMYGFEGEIWKEKEAKCRPARERNNRVYETNKSLQKLAFAQKSELPNIMQQIETELEKHAEAGGLLIEKLRLYRHNILQFDITPHYYPSNHDLYDAYNEDDRQWYINNSDESLVRIEQYFKKKYSDFEIRGDIRAYRRNGISTLRSATGELKL